jgi:hypothetical protein
MPVVHTRRLDHIRLVRLLLTYKIKQQKLNSGQGWSIYSGPGASKEAS